MKFLRFFIRKIKISWQSDAKINHSRGKVIEFIGPSGVGKSTLCSITEKKLSAKWNTLDLIQSTNIITIDEKLLESHWKVFKAKISSINCLKTKNSVKLKLATYFNKVISININLLHFENEYGFFLEEGICHNFAQELLDLNNEELYSLLKHRHLICILPKDPMFVVDQIKKRTSEGGHTVYHHEGLDSKALLDIVNESIIVYKEFITRIQNLNISSCQLLAEDGIEINSKKIIEFEASLFT